LGPDLAPGERVPHAGRTPPRRVESSRAHRQLQRHGRDQHSPPIAASHAVRNAAMSDEFTTPSPLKSPARPPSPMDISHVVRNALMSEELTDPLPSQSAGQPPG